MAGRGEKKKRKNLKTGIATKSRLWSNGPTEVKDMNAGRKEKKPFRGASYVRGAVFGQRPTQGISIRFPVTSCPCQIPHDEQVQSPRHYSPVWANDCLKFFLTVSDSYGLMDPVQ